MLTKRFSQLIKPHMFRGNKYTNIRSITTTSRVKSSIDEEEKNKNTINHALDRDTQLQQYCQKVYGKTSKYLGVTALSSAVTVGTGATLVSSGVSPDVLGPMFWATMGGGFIMSLGYAFKLGSVEPKYGNDKQTNKEVMLNESDRNKYASLLHVGMGMTLAPSLLMFHSAIPYAVAGTGVLVAGPILASMHLPKGQLLQYGPAVYSSLLGLVGISIGGIFFPILHDISVYGGLGLFTLYSAYDTHKMINDYENNNKDYISHATNYSLNAINIFIRLLEIIGYKKK